MIIFPNAKINLGLNIINRRDDGFHNIETIFYPVQIKDALEIVESDGFLFSSSGIPVSGNPDENLCVKAWNLVSADHHLPNVHMHLHKQIPIGAGLGGGSADGAFCIRLLNEKFKIGLSTVDMENYARRLGSDCAFFIRNEPVLATGKGDQFHDIKLDLHSYFLVLVMPPVHVSTAEAYRGIQLNAGSFSMSAIPTLPVEEWRAVLKNDFETTVFKNHPLIADLKAELYKAGALYASMSGSGASVYGIFKNEIRLPELESSNLVYYNV